MTSIVSKYGHKNIKSKMMKNICQANSNPKVKTMYLLDIIYFIVIIM